MAEIPDQIPRKEKRSKWDSLLRRTKPKEKLLNKETVPTLVNAAHITKPCLKFKN